MVFKNYNLIFIIKTSICMRVCVSVCAYFVTDPILIKLWQKYVIFNNNYLFRIYLHF